MKYAREGKHVTMMKMLVPEKGTSIFIIADTLSTEEMEKVALSMVEK